MGIGLGIFLLAVGAILAFAVHATVVGVDIHVVGGILMAAGFLSLVFTREVKVRGFGVPPLLPPPRRDC